MFPLILRSWCPRAYAAKRDRDEAAREIVRGRLEGLGPTTAAQLATSFGGNVEDVDGALLALEAEGTAMRGTFDHDWHRRRYSVVRSPLARAHSSLHA